MVKILKGLRNGFDKEISETNFVGWDYSFCYLYQAARSGKQNFGGGRFGSVRVGESINHPTHKKPLCYNDIMETNSSEKETDVRNIISSVVVTGMGLAAYFLAKTLGL